MAIDWLQFTIKKSWTTENIRDYLELVGYSDIDLLERKYGVNGYKDRLCTDVVAVNFNGYNEDMGINFCFFGEHFQDGKCNQEDFIIKVGDINSILKLQKNINRIDLQFTFTDRDFFKELEYHLAKGLFTCKASRRQEIKSFDNKTNEKIGSTYYFGSRRSDKFLRIYDKGAELGISKEELVRVEFEFKGDKALQIYERLVANNSSNAILKREVISFLRFIDSEDKNVNKSRAKTSKFWEDFLSKLDAAVDFIPLPKKESSIERKHKWLLNQVSPTLRKVKEDFNEDIDKDMLKGVRI